jgi:hypothetical protein
MPCTRQTDSGNHEIRMVNYSPTSTFESQRTIELSCATALKGLADCYSGKEFFKQKPGFNNHEILLSMAHNLRYIIIAQIGIKHWLNFHADCDTSLPDFWEYIFSRNCEINRPGDLGLAIWAGAESDADNCKILTDKLINNWKKLNGTCNAVELAWVIQGILCFSQIQRTSNDLNNVLKNAHEKLMSLYCQNSGFFARHKRRGIDKAVSRCIACFADQIYPILALANYGRHFNDAKSIEAAIAVSDKVCQLQGPEGQWWWHYNVTKGIIAEEYPVFSVHQDGMAPMALLAIDEVAGTDHSHYIEKGLKWLTGCNELHSQMILPHQGIIWRDIHRREIGKMYRLTRGLLTTAGRERLHRLTGRNLFGYVVNKECRPYHLGWILYAWANY